MNRVLITGATSMIGTALINECVKNSVEVLAIVRKNSKKISSIHCNKFVTCIEANLNELNNLSINKNCDVFYYFAWDGTTRENRLAARPQLNNINYTLDAVELAHRLGCKKFIGAGSQAEYGIVTEKIYPYTRVEPLTSYGIAKYAAGKLSRILCDGYGINHIWTRIFSVYGENDNENTMIKYAIKQFESNQVAKFSSAKQMWNYLYAGDAGKIFYLLGQRDAASGVYNVASEDTRQLKDFILELKSIYGSGAECEFSTETSQQTVSLNPDITSLVNAIGWVPDTSFSRGIRKVIVHMSNNVS